MTKEILILQKYNLEITEVVSDNLRQKDFNNLSEAYIGDGTIINSGFLMD